MAALQSDGTTVNFPFLCQYSMEQSGQVYTPNIPDFYFDHENVTAAFTASNLTASRHGFTYIFTLPSRPTQRNCSGNVSAIQYCFMVNHSVQQNSTQNVFSLLSLTRSSFHFTVDNAIMVNSTLLESKCTISQPSATGMLCCDTTVLTEEFKIPSTDNFAFGVVIVNMKVLPLVFARKYRAEQFIVALGPNFDSYEGSLNMSNRENNESLPLLRFLIGNLTIV